jgi:hypothetical protein
VLLVFERRLRKLWVMELLMLGLFERPELRVLKLWVLELLLVLELLELFDLLQPLELLELSLVVLLGLEQERVGKRVKLLEEYALFLGRPVTVPEVFTAGLGKSKKKKGDQHQREGVGANNATDLSREILWIAKRTGGCWRAVLGRRSGGIIED